MILGNFRELYFTYIQLRLIPRDSIPFYAFFKNILTHCCLGCQNFPFDESGIGPIKILEGPAQAGMG